MLIYLNHEKALSAALKEGNPQKLRKVFAAIYNDYAYLVSFCIQKYLADEETVKDLTNETFLAFFKNAEKVKTSIKYYLLTSAKNLALNHLAKAKHEVNFDNLEKWPFYEESESSTTYSSLLKDMQEVLTADELKIILMHALDADSFKDIGKSLGLSEGNARIKYHRALKKFKNSNRGKSYEKR